VTTDSKLKEIIAAQEEVFVRRQPRSKSLAEQATKYLAGGVTSSWQITAPQPVWLSHGRGSKVWDVDGNEYVDLHGGYGAALAGHAHPAIAAAITEQAARGTHFAQPTPDAVTVAEELAQHLGFDVFFPTIDVMAQLVYGKLIQPINHSYIPNITQAWPDFTNPF
jgi:glutamate-1-semialdehyde 2,1-aminomutase